MKRKTVLFLLVCLCLLAFGRFAYSVVYQVYDWNALFKGEVNIQGDTTLGNAAADKVTATAYFTKLRVGTGSTAGLTHGSDDVFIEGQLEADGTVRFDGASITFGDAATDKIVPTGYLSKARIGTGSTADLTHGDDDVFVEGQLEVDGTVRFDGSSITFGDAATDSVAMTGYLTKARIGTGSTADLTHGNDDVFIEGQMEVDGTTRFDGAIDFNSDVDSGVGGYKVPFNHMQSNVAASQSAVALDVLGLAGNTEFVMPYAGSVIGISVASNDARTAGTLTVDATVNGTVTGLTAVLNATNTQYKASTQAKDTDAFAAGNRLGVKITTDADWLPTTADIVVTVITEQ